MIINEVNEVTEQELQKAKGYTILLGTFALGFFMGRGSVANKIKDAYLKGILEGVTSAKVIRYFDKK